MKKWELRKIIREEIQSLNEGITTTDEYVSELESVIKKHFPKSYVRVEYTNNISPSITITFAVGRKSDWTNGIFQNDPVSDRIFITGFNKDNTLKDNQTLSNKYAGSYVIAPEEGSYMAYRKVKGLLRKATGSPEKIVKAVDSYYGKLKASMKSNIDKFSPEHSWVKNYL